MYSVGVDWTSYMETTKEPSHGSWISRGNDQKKNGEMFRQMAHLKCLEQGISNFNETLDLPYKLFLIFSAHPPKKLKKGKQKFNNSNKSLSYDAKKEKGEVNLTLLSIIGLISSHTKKYPSQNLQLSDEYKSREWID